MKYCITFIFFLSMIITCSSCVNFDSDRMPPTRLNYNEAMQISDKQQLLLNLVRFRYDDSPYFFSVNNIISQISYSNTFGATANNSWIPAPVSFSTSGSDTVTVGEAPTITYTPLQGDAFIKKMLTPIDLKIIYMLIHATDAHLSAILRTGVLKIGEFDNSIGTPHSKQTTAIELNKRFRRVTALLERLMNHSLLEVSSTELDGKFSIELKLRNFEKLPLKDQKILKKLGFSRHNHVVYILQTDRRGTTPPPRPNELPSPTPVNIAAVGGGHEAHKEGSTDDSKLVSIDLKEHKKAKPKAILWVETKPLFAVLLFLSKGVEVSPDEINRNIAVGSRLKNGQLLNWQYFTKGVIEIHCALHRPRNAFLYVKYRGHWYYICDDDTISKGTIFIVLILMNLYEGNVQNGLTPFYSVLT